MAAAAPTPSGATRLRPVAAIPVMDISAGRLSVKLEGLALAKILEFLAERSGARMVLYGNGDERVSGEFSDQPLEEGLRRLLRGYNVAIYYRSQSRNSDRGGSMQLAEVRIFANAGAGAQAVVFDPASSMKANDSKGAQLSSSQRRVDSRLAALKETLLEAKDSRERQEAAAALGRISGDAAIESLGEALLSDADFSVRASAAEALGKTWDESAVAPLSQSIANDPSSAVREAAARALGLSWSEKAVPALIGALLSDRDALVREQAARALGQTAGEEAVEALVQALGHDPRLFVRDAAAEALGAIGGGEALAALAQAAAHDPDGWVKETAAETAVNSPK
jgi:hypothetical protein